MRELAEVRANQPRQRFGALDKTSEPDVLPAFAVRHGGIGDTLEEMRALLHRAKERVGIEQPGLAGRRAVYLQVQAVELLPHFRAALLAHLPQVLASCSNAGKKIGRASCRERV